MTTLGCQRCTHHRDAHNHLRLQSDCALCDCSGYLLPRRSRLARAGFYGIAACTAVALVGIAANNGDLAWSAAIIGGLLAVTSALLDPSQGADPILTTSRDRW